MCRWMEILTSLRIEAPDEEGVDKIEGHEDEVRFVTNVLQGRRRDLNNEEIPQEVGCGG